jgi:hypothetical protein
MPPQQADRLLDFVGSFLDFGSHFRAFGRHLKRKAGATLVGARQQVNQGLQ